jgi:inhibitor of KinA
MLMSIYHPYTMFPLGDSALTIDFGNSIDDQTNQKVLQLYHQIKDAHIPYLTDLVPAYSSLTVYYDVISVYSTEHSAFEAISELIENITEEKPKPVDGTKRLIDIPVCYEIKYALDIYEIARQKNLSVEEIIAIHTSKTYRVYMLGFIPGFSYMGLVDEQIEVPRKTEPRPNVEAGSVGIAGRQTGIYPLNSPGGWQIIGKTPLRLFNKDLAQPVLFEPGDEVKFYSITEDEFEDFKKRNS